MCPQQYKNFYSTNIKTWLASLNDVQDAINKISGLSTVANGATHMFDDTVLVQQYADSLRGLNLQQAQLALSTKLLSDNQKEQILVKAGLKASEDFIQAELIQSALLQNEVNDETREAILYELELIDLKTKKLLVDKGCDAQTLKSVLTQKLKNKTDERGILTTLGLGEANLFTAETFKLMGKQALMALKAIATNPITWVIAGIVGAVAAFDLLTTSVGEARKSFEALEEVTSELESTQSELTSINDKIAEIQSKGKLELTDKIELQKLETERDILEDQVRLLGLKKELAADKSNKDAVDAVGNPMRGFGKKTRGGWTTSYGAVDIILDGTSRKSGQGSLIDAYEDLAEIEEQIRNTNQSDTKKLTKLYEKKADIQADINEDKNTLADVYSENLELLEQMTGDDPATQAAREKLETQNQKIAQYIFSAEEIAQKNLTRFKEKFASNYNANLDLIQDDSNHKRSVNDTAPRKDSEGYGTIARSGVTEEGLDGLIAKNKELNQSFVDGKITTSEYFDNLSSEIEKINLDDVGKILDGGKGDNSKTDYIEEVVANLAGQVSDALMYADQSFKAGETSVSDYIDTLDSGIDAQKKLLKSTYDLEDGENGLVKAVDESDLVAKNAADSFNDLVEAQEGLDAVDEFADKMESYNEKLMQFVENDTTITDAILGDPELFNAHMNNVTDSLVNFANASEQNFATVSQQLQDSLGVSQQKAEELIRSGGDAIQAQAGQNMDAVNKLTDNAMANTSGAVTNASQAIGGVLSALGEAISGFTYNIKATPYIEGDFDFTIEDGKPKLSLANFGFDISGSGGSSAANLSKALSSAGTYFSNAGSTNSDSISSYGSNKGNNDKTTTSDSSGTKDGGSSSSSKADDAKKAEEDRIQKELEALKAGLEARNQIIEKYKESIDITDFGLDIAEEKDFALRTDLLNSKLSQVTAYGQAMRKEFERVSNVVPKTADQAEALASQLSTLGSNMRNNVKTLRETQVAIQKLSIDAVTMSAKDNLDDMQTTLNRLEKRIELLNGDNKNDYKYTNKILNMETLLPTNADMTSRRKSRSRADQSIIKTEEETQNVLNDMFQEQIKLNDNLREEERQALLADMETMRSDMVINMQNASSDYVNYGNEVINTTKAYTKTVTDTVNSMNLVLPKPDTSKFAEACNEVEKMISNLGKGVSYEITPKSDGRGGGDAASLLHGNKKTIIKNVADGQLGVPYLWGGVTPGAGLDCSGLTQYVYRSVGVNIPRIADDQLKSGVGTRVDARNLQVGDQLFFSEDGKTASHTGIYVGNGMMIHAPSTGDVVKYSNINSEYYQSRLMGAKRYAFGTPSSFSEIALVGDDKEGKLNKIRPELIVGKDGVRLAGQNGPEFVNLESGDQVIPYEKTKQILQRSDISTPRYASGTVSPGAIAAYIRQKYPEVTDAAIAGLLGNIQQESSFVVDAKTIEGYGSGSSRQVARWGLFQLDDERVPGWSNIVQNGTWQQQIDRALANARYENSGMGSLSKYNAWDRVLTNTNLSPTEAAKLWDDLFERSDGKSRNTRATNAEKYYTNLLNGTLENTNALNDNTSALKEELDPVKQAVEEINKFSEAFEADIKKLITPVRLKEKELADTEDMTKGDKQLELFKLYLPVATEAAKNGTAKYSELLAQYNQYLADVDNKIKKYEQDIVDAYEDGLAEIKDSVYDVEKAAVEVKNNLIEAAEKRNDKIDSYISARNFYGDWAEYGDTEYKAIERKIKEYDRLLQEEVITQRQYNEAIESLKQDEVSLLKNEISSALDRRIEEIDFQSSKLSSQQTLLQAHYD